MCNNKGIKSDSQDLERLEEFIIVVGVSMDSTMFFAEAGAGEAMN